MKCLGTIFVPVVIFLTYQAAASTESSPEPYLGETPPGLTPELFAPAVIERLRRRAADTEAEE